MKPEELMIGDWIMFPNSIEKVQEVSFVEGKGYCASFAASATLFPISIDLLKPIPITPEILEKNGFELRSDGLLWHEFPINDFNDYRNYIFIQFRKDCEEVKYCEIRYHNKIYSNLKIIQYVHELQHIIKVYKINKEIVL